MSNNMELDLNTHDIIIGRAISRIGSTEYVAQLVKTNLLLLAEEWDLDETLGIDWYNIMGSNYDLAIIQGIVSQTIIETEGVLNLDTIELELNTVTRKLSIDFTATADSGAFTNTIII